MTHFTKTCADGEGCQGPVGDDLFCDLHRAEYDFTRFMEPFVDDVCQCLACKSDVVGIVPCLREVSRG